MLLHSDVSESFDRERKDVLFGQVLFLRHLHTSKMRFLQTMNLQPFAYQQITPKIASWFNQFGICLSGPVRLWLPKPLAPSCWDLLACWRRRRRWRRASGAGGSRSWFPAAGPGGGSRRRRLRLHYHSTLPPADATVAAGSRFLNRRWLASGAGGGRQKLPRKTSRSERCRKYCFRSFQNRCIYIGKAAKVATVHNRDVYHP